MPEQFSTIIVDDDPMTRKILASFVDQTDSLLLAGTFENAIDAGNFLEGEEVDILLLDVEMPGMSGLELIDSLVRKPRIILITSKEKYAVDAFEADVADYIVKPATLPRFLKAIHKAIESLPEKNQPEIRQDKLFIKSGSQWIGISIEEISLVEALADYVKIHTPAKRYTVYSSMKGIAAKLPNDQFMRVHRSFIVNIGQIEKIEDNTLILGDHLIPVGVTYQKHLMARLNLL